MSSVYGYHSVKEQLLNAANQVHRLVVLQGSHDRRRSELVSLAKSHSIRVQYVTRQALDRLCKGDNHQGLLIEIHDIRLRTEQELKQKIEGLQFPLLLVLEDLQDPGNVGACCRTASAVGIDAVILPKNRSGTLNATVLKTSSGTTKDLFIAQVSNLVRLMTWMKEQGVWVVGTSGSANQSYLDVDYAGSIAIVMGNEESGLRKLTKDVCDYLVQIPVKESVGSLNVSVATGVMLYEALRQRNSK